MGTRLAPYTDVTPKPLFTLQGRPLLYYWLTRLAKAGCAQVFINTHHLHEQIETYLAANVWPLQIQTVHEPILLGTGGAIKNIGPWWQDSDLMVINSDIVCDFNLVDLMTWHHWLHNDVSLLLTKSDRFNTVFTDNSGNILRFDAKDDPANYTFTGIQVLSPAVLDYIPAAVLYHSIDAYRRMLADGRPVKGLVREQCGWQDLGDAQRYRETALQLGARKTFGKIFDDNATHIEVEMLQGDGSDRAWRRLRTLDHTMIVADHGLTAPENADAPREVDAFINIGRHLLRKDLPVAQIYFHDNFAGLVFLEDLGDANLQKFVRNAAAKSQVIGLYLQIADAAIRFSQEGIKGFEPDWAWQTKSYDRNVILVNECAYFKQRFLEEHLKINTAAFDLQADFAYLADKITQHAVWGLMHRDLQSRNIMLRENKPYFIDYQGARRGPVQYDLASLLYDPYVMLDENTRKLLLDFCCEHELLATQSAKIEKGFYYCAVSRSMQALGAYAFLSRIKAKPQFQSYMKPALQNLDDLLNDNRFKAKFSALKAVTKLVRTILS